MMSLQTRQQKMFLVVLALVAFGLLMVYSASSVTSFTSKGFTPYSYFLRQACWAALAISVLFFLWNLDYRIWNRPLWVFGAVTGTSFFLLAAYLLDSETHRWIRFGFINIQPSELAKPALVLFTAFFLSRHTEKINDWKVLTAASLTIGFVTAVILLADVGTAAVLLLSCAALFAIAGLRMRYLMLAALAACLLLGVAIAKKPYRMVRLLHFVDPELSLASKLVDKQKLQDYLEEAASALDPGYQVRQSKIALGSGGALGLGLFQGRQKLFYLPAAHTDFIYAVVGEELGFVGTSFVLAAFLFLFVQGVRISVSAPDSFGFFLALGATLLVFVQALMNMAVVTGMAPTKGIPLPMLSYGGSSLLSTLTLMGLVLSVGERSS